MICGNGAFVKGLELERQTNDEESQIHIFLGSQAQIEIIQQKTIELINLLLKGFVSALESP